MSILFFLIVFSLVISSLLGFYTIFYLSSDFFNLLTTRYPQEAKKMSNLEGKGSAIYGKGFLYWNWEPALYEIVKKDPYLEKLQKKVKKFQKCWVASCIIFFFFFFLNMIVNIM